MNPYKFSFGRAFVLAAVIGAQMTSDDSRCVAEHFTKRATLYCGLPASRYGHDDRRAGAFLIAGPGIEEQVVMVLDNPQFVPVEQMNDLPWRSASVPASVSILNREGFTSTVQVAPAPQPGKSHVIRRTNTTTTTDAVGASSKQTVLDETVDQETVPVPPRQYGTLAGQKWHSAPLPVARPTLVRRKRFAPLVPAIDAGNVHLERVGIAIYETGQLACTGLLVHNGGPDGTLLSNSVTVRVRAYGTNPLAQPTVPPNGPAHADFVQTFRVSRGDPLVISLVPCGFSEPVRRHFDEISHFEIILETRQDR